MFALPRIPIWQAPTGSVAGPELALAVAEAGGMGALGLTWTEPDDARQKVRSVFDATRGSFLGNFALHFPPVSLIPALEAGLKVVSFSWGLPSAEASLVKSFGASFGVQVACPEGAKRALDLGADFLVCQGVEAGGHVQATRPLLETLTDVVTVAGLVPVVAAGGIGTGAAIAQVLALGAKGAMLGTRFVATRESLAHEDYKRQIVASHESVLTLCFDGGWPGAIHRVLRNRTLDEWEAAGCPLPGTRPGEGDAIGFDPHGEEILRYDSTAPRVGMTGETQEMCLYAGTSCADVHDVPGAADMVARLWSEAQARSEL